MRRNGVVVVVAILVVSSLIVGLPRPDAEDVSDAEEVQDDLTARAEGIFNPLCPLCPKFPPDLQKAEGQDGSVKLTWYSNLDYPLTEYYKIYYCTDENDEWKKAASVSADPLVHVYEFTHYGVHNGVTYYYLVKAANYVLCPMCAIVPMFLEHESPSSKIKSAVPSGPPSEPLNVAATYYEDYRGAPHIIVNWSYPEDDGGSRVFGFNVYRGESHGSEVFYGYTDCLAFADIGIEEFGVYYYQIAAVNCISEGPKSSEVGISVPEFPPEPPTIAELFPVGFDGPSRAAGEVEITASFKNIGADVLMNLGFRVGLFLSRSQWEADILDLGPSLIPLYYHTQYNVWQDMTFTIGPVTVSIPEAAYGDYYYAIIVDTGNTVVELNEGNNSRVFGKVTISPPGCDIVANLVEGPLVYTCLEPLKIRRSFSHEGPIGLVTISYAVMASVDNIITRDDYRIAYSEYTEITLGAGECDDSYIVLTYVPNLPAGTYYYGLIVDYRDVIIDVDVGDNTVASMNTMVVVPRIPIDLAAIAIEGPSECVEGSVVELQLTISNLGIGTARLARFALVLTEDEDIDLYGFPPLDLPDTVVYAEVFPALDGGDSFSTSLNVTIPMGVNGTYYYGLQVTPYIQYDANGGNNAVVSTYTALIAPSPEPPSPLEPLAPRNLLGMFYLSGVRPSSVDQYRIYFDWIEPANADDLGWLYGYDYYAIYRTQFGFEPEAIAWKSDSYICYTDFFESLSPGTSYVYQVCTLESPHAPEWNEGPKSNEFRVTVPFAPSAPLGVVAVPSEDSILLEWQPPLSDGGLPVVSYNVYRGVSPDNLEFVTTTYLECCYLDTDVALGDVYYYMICAENMIGEGDNPDIVSTALIPEFQWIVVPVIGILMAVVAASALISRRRRESELR